MNFSSILSLSAEELRCVSNQQIVDCVQDVLKDGGDTCEAFEFVFTRFSSILSLDEINELVCQPFLPYLKTKFDEAIVEQLPDVIQTIFQLFMVLSESVHEKIDDIVVFGITDVHPILVNSLYFLGKTVPHNFLYSHDEINQLLAFMQDSVTKILISTKFHLKVTVNELKNGRNVLHGLVELGQQQSYCGQQHLKSMASTWKHLSRFATEFHPIYRSIQEQNLMDTDGTPDDLLDWIELCVQIFCNLITDNVHKTISNDHNEKKENVTKITVFFLKLIESLAEEYANDDFRGQSEIIKLFEMIDGLCEKCDDENVKNHLQTLHTKLSSILSNIYNCDRFANELLENYIGDHMRVCLEVTKLLLHSSITSNDLYFNNENLYRNIFYHLLVQCVPNEMHQVYVSSRLYDKLVASCTILVMTSMNQQMDLENILVEATLMDDIAFRMPILLDIWTQFLRYVSNETLLMYYKLWLSISSDFPAIPRNPSCVLVQKLLKLTLSLIPESQRSEIVREQTKKNSLRFDCISNSQVSKLQQCAQQIVDRIKQTMTKIDPNSEIVSSRECNELMSAFSNFQQPASSHLLSILNDQDLTISLINAIRRSETRNVDVLLSHVYRIILWQKYMCNNYSMEVDFTVDKKFTSEVKIYILELIALSQLSNNHINELSMFDGTDDLTKLRLKRFIKNNTQNGNSQYQQMSEDEYLEYIQQILQLNREFGCTSGESCLNQSAMFKKCIEQMMLEAQKLEQVLETEPQVDLANFSNEITSLSDLFNRLKTNI